MAFLKKDVNLKLAFLILVLTAAIAAFGVIYQNKFEGISAGYKNKTEQLEKITAKAVSEETRAYEISQREEILSKDKEALEIGYKGLKSENQALKEGLNEAKAELWQVKSELQDKINKLNLLQNRFSQAEQSLIERNNELSKLSARISRLCNELEAAGGSDVEC